jgi:hypothetical protein
MQQRLTGPRTRGGNWSATVIPQDLRMATTMGMQLKAARERSDTEESSSSSPTVPEENTPGHEAEAMQSEALDLPVAESGSTSSDSTSSSENSEKSGSSSPAVPKAETREQQPEKQPEEFDLLPAESGSTSSENTTLSDSDRNALLAIVRMIFGDNYTAAFDDKWIHTPVWLDFEPTTCPTVSAPPARMFLLLETEMYRHYGDSPMVHSCLQQLLRQDIGIWAVSALQMNNYRLVAVPTQSDPTDSQTLYHEKMRIPMPVSPDYKYVLWPRLNIHFVPTKFCRWIALMDAKTKRGYFKVLRQNKVKDIVQIDRRQGIQDATLRNPISRALIGDLDWESDLVREYVRSLFNATNDSKSLEAFIFLLTRQSVEAAAETSWLNILADHNMQKDKSKTFLSAAVLNWNTTCLPDDVIQQFREYAKLYLIRFAR